MTELADDGFKAFISGLTENAGIDRGMSVPELLEHLGNKKGAKVWMVIHGMVLIYKVDACILSYECQDIDGVEDYILQCEAEGQFFSISAKLLSPQNYEVLKARHGINLSRIFKTKKERDTYYDDICYVVETNIESTTHMTRLIQHPFLEELRRQWKKRNQ
jgi:hypothetical protein